MDFITGFLLLVAGGVIGFFVARYWFVLRKEDSKDKNVENTIKEILAQQTSSHLMESRQLISAIEKQCSTLREQFNHFEASIADANEEEDSNQLTFFGDQANAYLRHKGSRNKPQSTSSDYQPLDYAGGNSGLLSESEQQQANARE